MMRGMHRHLRGTSPLPLRLVAVMLAVLGLLAMHSLLSIAQAPSAAAQTHSAEHEHGNDHEHHGQAQVQPGHESHAASSAGGSSEPCSTCCAHESETACPVTPAKVGNADALAEPADVYTSYGPAPAHVTCSTGPQAPSTPPCLIALSISRT